MLDVSHSLCSNEHLAPSFYFCDRSGGAGHDFDWGGSAEDRAGWSAAEENHRTMRREGSGKMPNWIRKDKQVTAKHAAAAEGKSFVSLVPQYPTSCTPGEYT